MGYTTELMKDLEGYISSDTFERVLNCAVCERDRLLLLVGWRTGRRISEILLLKKEHINWDSRLVKFKILKKRNKEYYKLKAVDSDLLNQLYVYTKNLAPEDYLFYGRDKGSHVSRRQAYNIIRKAAETANVYSVGLKPPHPHMLRHSFAINFLKKAKNQTIAIKLLQTILEHSDLRMTSHYLQFGQADLREELENVFKKEE